jgi:hypothetical protein
MPDFPLSIRNVPLYLLPLNESGCPDERVTGSVNVLEPTEADPFPEERKTADVPIGCRFPRASVAVMDDEDDTLIEAFSMERPTETILASARPIWNTPAERNKNIMKRMRKKRFIECPPFYSLFDPTCCEV